MFKKNKDKKSYTETHDLKPCPFCGGRAAICENFCHSVAVVCKECGARTTSFEANIEYSVIDKVAGLWNQRSEKERK